MRRNKIFHKVFKGAKFDADSNLQNCDSYNLDSRDLDCHENPTDFLAMTKWTQIATTLISQSLAMTAQKICHNKLPYGVRYA